MIKKYFILNATNFGVSNEYNQAVLEGYNTGFLTSASLCANGEAFDNAVNDILPDCSDLGIGAQLNITQGTALSLCYLLREKTGKFDKNFLYYLFARKNASVLDHIKMEFEEQLNKILEYTKVDFLTTYQEIHAIPEIFEIVCKLAKENNIKYVQTHFEDLYFIPNLEKHLKLNYPANLLKVMLLQNFTKQNRKTLDEYELHSNDFMLGLNYYGMMNSEAIEQGLKVLDEDCIVQVDIQPRKYRNSTKDWHTREFGLSQNLTLKDTITRLGFEITNYKKLG
jgi:predicted glycoside hydrolase/deacetylase ChbG (UPF0249 family)